MPVTKSAIEIFHNNQEENFTFSKGTKYLNSIDLNLNNNNAIISLKKYKEEVNMSVIIMYYDKNQGAIIVTDSRETGDYYKNDIQKIYQNDDMIIGQTGLNWIDIGGAKIEFGKPIVNKLLEGKTIEEAINQKIKDRTLRELIPEDKTITIFQAKKNGEVYVYDISKNNLIVKKGNNYGNFFWNIPEYLEPVYNFLHDYFIEKIKINTIKAIKNRLISIVNILSYIESEKEKNFLGIGIIGGKTQVAQIKFEK